MMKKPGMAALAGLFTLQCASALAHSDGAVERLDRDGDRQVSREEFELSERHRALMPFARADRDGDGAITREEMLARVESAARERAQTRRERAIVRFDAIDIDGDRVVTRLEAEDHAFARLDADGNGFITEREARAVPDRGRKWRSARRRADP